MTTTEFKEKMDTLIKKTYSEIMMHGAIVYDEDHLGKIYLSPDGEIFVSDNHNRWVKINYILDDIESMKYDIYYDDEGEIEESYIYIFLSNMDVALFRVYHASCNTELILYIKKKNSSSFRREIFENDYNIKIIGNAGEAVTIYMSI